MADLRSSALGYLRRGDVEVLEVKTIKDTVFVTASVRSHVPNKSHLVDGQMGPDAASPAITVEEWRCTCPNYLDETCPHRAAVQMVTGGKTEIRPR